LNWRALLGVALALALAAGAAQADLLRHCAPPPPLDAVQHDRLFRFAALVRETLDQSGQRLALIARAGTDNALDVLYSFVFGEPPSRRGQRGEGSAR